MSGEAKREAPVRAEPHSTPLQKIDFQARCHPVYYQ